MIRITKMEQTCHGCPSQWDAWDEHGSYYYIRYRWGFLTIDRDDVDGNRVFDCRAGGTFDGDMSLDELRAATKGSFAFEV